MSAKRILVTGASGFIGRRCVPRLAARGYEVHAVSSRDVRASGAQWHRCDLLEPAAAEFLIELVRPSHLLHLAWIATPGLFWESPLNSKWLDASVRLAEAFYAGGGTRAVGIGTCAEYGPSSRPCREDSTPLAPNTRYGEAKAAMGQALASAARNRGTCAWARLFFPYGPGEPPGRFIPSVIDALICRTPLACTEGLQVRDFVHADDVADACVALVDAAASGVYNIGTGQGRSLREVAAAIVAELGHAELVRFGERKAAAHEPAYLVADMSKTSSEIGWRARLALEEGIHMTIAARATA